MPHSASEKVRKTVTTLLLDGNSRGILGSPVLSASLVLCIFTIVYLILSYNGFSKTVSLKMENLYKENEALRELLKQHELEKEKRNVDYESIKKVLEARSQQIQLAQEQLDTKEGEVQGLKKTIMDRYEETELLKQQVHALRAQVAALPVTNLEKTPAPQFATVPAVPLNSFKFNLDNPLYGMIMETVNLADEAKTQRDAIRNAMKHAWGSYEKYAWGTDELKPVSKSTQNWLQLGLTIVDAIDTLYIMGMMDEFNKGVDWIKQHLDFNKNIGISLFETNIRVLGGLLSGYEFSKDQVLLDKGVDLAERLLKGFNERTGLPYATVNLANGMRSCPSWTGGSCILSEMGTLQLEFAYVAYHAHKPHLSKMPLSVFKHLDGLNKPVKGLYPLYINVDTGQFTSSEVSLGALGDSFYEYLIKLYEMTNKEAKGYERMFYESLDSIIDNLLFYSSPSNLMYIAQLGRGNQVLRRMEHLACFTGGMFALGAQNFPKNSEKYIKYMEVAAGITNTCHEMYTRTATKIGPEYVEFTGNDFVVPGNGKHYLLRPEVIESYFYMWRYTHEQKYRDWAWEAFEAIERHCKVDGGYSGIHDVGSTNPSYDDLQQSFFLAEVLKYLYLTFTPDEVISLDQYVINTEAHPFKKFPESIQTMPQELQFQFMM